RVYYATNDPTPKYPTVAAGTEVSAVTGLDIDAADLLGKYFIAANYTLLSDAATYTITCTNAILDTARTLNELGTFGGGL
ncbi:MAG: hypothetical protein V1715_14630, partial [bacterium]